MNFQIGLPNAPCRTAYMSLVLQKTGACNCPSVLEPCFGRAIGYWSLYCCIESIALNILLLLSPT